MPRDTKHVRRSPRARIALSGAAVVGVLAFATGPMLVESAPKKLERIPGRLNMLLITIDTLRRIGSEAMATPAPVPQ